MYASIYKDNPILDNCKRTVYGAAFCLLASAYFLIGCSVTTPIASLVPDEDVATGSVSPIMFVDRLSTEDWRRAKAAIAVALDPQSTGMPVKWDNPETKNTGSFTANGAFVSHNDLVCRPFLATLMMNGAYSNPRGFACRQGPNDWVIEEPAVEQNKKQLRPGGLF